MLTSELAQSIKAALESSPRNSYVGELHLQIIKYFDQLKAVSGKEFCEEVGIPRTYGSEFSKMIKIAPRLLAAGLDPSKI